MKIYAKSVPKHVPLPQFKKALNFYTQKLVPRLHHKLKVFVEFEYPDEDNIADVTYIDTNVRPKEFKMNFSPDLKGKTLFKCLAHETVHVKQFATGQMTDLVRYPDKTVWMENGKKVYITPTLDNKMGYWYQPWEVEAYGMEMPLYWDFVSTYNLKPTRDLIIR